LPEGFGDLISTVPYVTETTTASADIAWLTASFDANGDGVDQPPAPMMVPLEVTGVDPTFASFLPQPERLVVQNLLAGEGVLSESAATLRSLGPGSSLRFRGGEEVRIVGTLPDTMIGAHELLVTRETGERLGVAQDRYVLFHVRADAGWTSRALTEQLRQLLPADVPYPAIEVRAPGETAYLRANDRAAAPMFLKRDFGEFLARPDPKDRAALEIDPAWVQRHIRSASIPGLGTVTCHEKTIIRLEQAMRSLGKGADATVVNVGPCFDPVADPDDPSGPLTDAAWGAAILINPARNEPGDAPSQAKRLLRAMEAAGFGWAGEDEYPQGALFRYRVPAGPLT
jgi:hypothetical protein